eukprot:8502839-Alexandrium_andersonii.AAC.1
MLAGVADRGRLAARVRGGPRGGAAPGSTAKDGGDSVGSTCIPPRITHRVEIGMATDLSCWR